MTRIFNYRAIIVTSDSMFGLVQRNGYVSVLMDVASYQSFTACSCIKPAVFIFEYGR
jgi:hypothetical protein